MNLLKAYNELRNEKSNYDYGKDFDKLDPEEQKIVKILPYEGFGRDKTN